jgi:rhomboid protease GluP
MSEEPEVDDFRWIERVVRIAGALGFNEVRVRWKLMRWAEKSRAARRRTRGAFTHVGYEHAVCHECGRIQPRGTRTCGGCGARMTSRLAQVMRRAGVYAPVPLSASSLIGVLIVACFVRQVAAAGGHVMTFDGASLVQLGAHVPSLERAGQWWRLATAVFLHAGLIHAAFNLVALSSIGPQVEEVFGFARTLFFYVVAGIVANIPTLLLHREAVGIGASGAICGVIGLAAGWGHRDGTTIGKATRNAMLKWMVYIGLFGIGLHFLRRGNVDHSAHVTGFLAGGLLGYAFGPLTVRGNRSSWDPLLGVVGFALMLAIVVMIMIGGSIPLPPGWP